MSQLILQEKKTRNSAFQVKELFYFASTLHILKKIGFCVSDFEKVFSTICRQEVFW